MRKVVLRTNAAFLAIASTLALLFWDVPGIFLGVGRESHILGRMPYAGIGFLEAHGLAVIFGVLLWRAAPSRSWHLAAAAVEVLLGTANIICWPIFIAADVVPVGYMTTVLHGAFAMLQLWAASRVIGGRDTTGDHPSAAGILPARARYAILRANAAFLSVASIAGLSCDLLAVFFGVGPQSRILGATPNAAIGFVEAHGLALILSVLLWRASHVRSWHLTALATEVLLGTANLALWQFFIAADAVAAGYVTTMLHWTFAGLQLLTVVPSQTMHGIGRGRVTVARDRSEASAYAQSSGELIAPTAREKASSGASPGPNRRTASLPRLSTQVN